MTGRAYLDRIDHETSGPRCDVTPLFADAKAFAAAVDDIGRALRATPFDYIAAIDALGFILGTALAVRFGKGLVVVRKGGKLPVDTSNIEFVDYSGSKKTLEMHTGILQAGARVMVVDEWVETGAQVNAAIQLLERQRAAVAGVAAIHIDENEATKRLASDYRCFALSGRWAVEPTSED